MTIINGMVDTCWIVWICIEIGRNEWPSRTCLLSKTTMTFLMSYNDSFYVIRPTAVKTACELNISMSLKYFHTLPSVKCKQ